MAETISRRGGAVNVVSAIEKRRIPDSLIANVARGRREKKHMFASKKRLTEMVSCAG
jgi:hypothetical protein